MDTEIAVRLGDPAAGMIRVLREEVHEYTKGMQANAVQLTAISEKLAHILSTMSELKAEMAAADKKFVTLERFLPIETLVTRANWVILAAVLAAILALVVNSKIGG